VSSGDAAAEVRDIAAQLSEIAEKLRDPEIGDEQAAALAREAAELVSRAGNEIDRATRESEPDAG
jgi:hypothetical protein